MHRLMIAQKQRALALQARRDPQYRFNHLYDLLHWDKWIHDAAQRVLSRPGSDTAGVDGKTRDYFRETYEQQINSLVEDLKKDRFEPQPVRRTYIPKANGKKRPLGIPALCDRIVQEAIRMALDPIYESDFQPYSFGFRKGRCTMDAIAVLMPLFNERVRHFYVIEGDLQSYFDTVHHRKLISLLKRRLKDRKLVDLLWKFLKAGVMEGHLFARTEAGVPQGGIISPLLANIYLHEFDRWAETRWHRRTPYERQQVRRSGGGNYAVVRYADDFVVVTSDTIQGVHQAKAEIKEYLESELHLTLSEDKTRITHVSEGFDFLGFHIQRVKPEGRWVIHLRPREESVKRIKAKIKDLTSGRFVTVNEVTRLTTLNRLVQGWCEYYKYISLHRDLEQISRYAWHRYHKWLLKKHKGSRKCQLIQDKTAIVHGRQRWIATLKEGDRTVTVPQWLPSPQELKRWRYRQKGRDGFSHPYLFEEKPSEWEDPRGDQGPPEAIYHVITGSDRPGYPLDWAERKLRVKVRDNFTCTKCGSKENLHVHHRRGGKSNRPQDLETLCSQCHKAVHGFQEREG